MLAQTALYHRAPSGFLDQGLALGAVEELASEHGFLDLFFLFLAMFSIAGDALAVPLSSALRTRVTVALGAVESPILLICVLDVQNGFAIFR